MKLGNTFTYRQSELPELSLETKGEIAALDIRIAEFILQNRGHYHALQELSEILSNCADTCELNLNSIRITSDSASDKTVSMRDLPPEEKLIIYSASFTSSVLLKLLVQITGSSMESLAKELSEQALKHAPNPSRKEVDDYIEAILKAWKNKDGNYFIAIL